MGAWGAGAFENDDAGDWVRGLEKAEDSEFLRATFARVTDLASTEYLEAPNCSEALAAAEAVAALLGRPHAELPEDVETWVEAHRGLHERSLAPEALAALARIRSNSELKELWDESGGEEWYANLDDLERRLRG